MGRKYFRASGASGQVLLGADQAQQAWMSVVVDIGVLERDFEQFVERARRPFRIGERILVLRELDLVAIDTLGRRDVACIQCVLASWQALSASAFQVLSRFCDGTMQKKNTSCGLQASASRCRLIFLAGRYCTARSSSMTCSMSRLAPLIGTDNEAQLARPVVVFGRMQPGPVVDVADLDDRQRRQQRLHAADGRALFDLNFSEKLGFTIFSVGSVISFSSFAPADREISRRWLARRICC